MARVLMVDDNADLRIAWRALLEVSGHDVVEAQHGKAALVEIDGPRPFDVVLLDLLMPEMDGRTFLEELYKRPSRPPVVVTSEFVGLIDTPHVVAKIKKPVRKEDLLAAVQSAAAVQPTERVTHPSAHVLVVEDDRATREMLQRYLQSKQYQVTVAEDGHDAINALEAVPFDVVVLDMMMPGMTGREVLRRMRATPALKKTPVIIASAAASPDDVEVALSDGADDYVTKPFDLRALAARIEGRVKRRGPSAVAPRALGKGSVLDDKYELIAPIEGGGFGMVFRGRHLQLQADVAVKILSAAARTREEADALRAEGVAACMLQHPNAVRVLDFAVMDGGVAYLVMELLNGPSFKREVDRAPLPLSRVVQVMTPVCNVLAAAHASRMIHRDVKPANIVLHQGPTGEIVKVVDFGIAKLTDPDGVARERDGTVPGTLHYMAPEALRGEDVTEKCDVFAVGIVLYEALTGQKPFGLPGPDTFDFVERVVHATPVRPSQKNARLDRKVDDVVLAALARRPADRPAARELARDLRELLVYA